MTNSLANKENKILSELIDINTDASKFYKSALERVRNPRLEASFSDLKRLHESVVNDLSGRIRQNGGSIDADGTLSGKGARLFTEIMAKIGHDVDETLVVHLEEAEDRCLHSMRDALENKNMRPDTRALLVNELGALQRSHDYMKSLKDSMRSNDSRAA